MSINSAHAKAYPTARLSFPAGGAPQSRYTSYEVLPPYGPEVVAIHLRRLRAGRPACSKRHFHRDPPDGGTERHAAGGGNSARQISNCVTRRRGPCPTSHPPSDAVSGWDWQADLMRANSCLRIASFIALRTNSVRCRFAAGAIRFNASKVVASKWMRIERMVVHCMSNFCILP